jgi:hypothetical protein
MTEIKMLRTLPVAPSGIRVEMWHEGSSHEVDDNLLSILIDAGACEIVTKAIPAAPENKARKRGRPRKAANND